MRADRARLGIDFGTSSTVAVLGQPDGQVRPLLFGETPILPSAVCVDWRAPDPAFLIGRDAIHAGRAHPDSFEPNPKLRIDDGSVLLGTAELPVTELIGAVLRRVGTEAERVAGAPVGEVTLTYPASWGPRRRSVLQEAARIAGLAEPALVAEPVAAAAYFVDTLAQTVPVGRCVVVYDFGAGTFDASVVGRTDDGFTVLAEEGLRDAGGLDIDNAVVAYFGATYGVSDGDSWRRLTHPETPADRRVSRHFWDDVRTGKEMLSRAASTSIYLPLVETDALLGREQLEHLARPLLDRTVAATAAAIRAAQVDASRIAGVFLVGGSSRIPLAATLLHRTLGIAPTIIEQPELVVAGGSLVATATSQALPAAPVPPAVVSASVPVSPPSMPAAPVSPVAAPVSPVAAPVSPVAAPVSPVAPPGPAPVFTLPSMEVPSTLEQPPPAPWEATPAAPVSPAVGAASVSPAVGAAPVPPAVGAAPVSPAGGGASVSPAVGAASVSPAVGGASVLPAVGAASVPSVAGQFAAAPVSAVPGGAVPVSAAPASTTPVSAAPVSAVPGSAAPVSAPPVAAAPGGAAPEPEPESSGWPALAPLFTAPPVADAPAPASGTPGRVAAVRGLGIAVAGTALLRHLVMLLDSGPSAVVSGNGSEPFFDYAGLGVLVVLGGWLAARPAHARPVLGVAAGFAPWALLPIIGDIALVSRYFDWTDELTLMLPALSAQLVALFAVVWLVGQAALRARTAPRLLPLGLAAVAFWTPPAALLWLSTGRSEVIASGQVFRIGLAVGLGTLLIYAAAGARPWAGWTIGAWIGGALVWLLSADLGNRAQGLETQWMAPALLLLAVAAVLLLVLLRADRGAARPAAGLAKGPATVALVAAGIAAAGFASILWDQLERWSYQAAPNINASVFSVAAGTIVLIGGALLLVARRSAGAAAYFVGAAAGPVSVLAGPTADALNWNNGVGLVLLGAATLVLAAVLIRSVPTRLSWPHLAVAAACLLLIMWTTSAVPYNRLDRGDQWLMLLVFVAIPATIVWKGGVVTAGALLGVAAGTLGDQFLTVYRTIDDTPGIMLGLAVLATLTTGLLLARSAPDRTG
ncbi:Hsp70 family protein [Dactylosporangium sp. CA-152071]|uniref:Hsp70 family protein n=1 Tax=Dactylosporangium sp. CA-152071 TaxID=3239933 RepID=UPI003D8FCCC7